MARKNSSPLFAGIDVGSAKTTVVIGRPGTEAPVEVLGSATVATHGMRKSQVVDPHRVGRTLQEAIDKASKEAGGRPDSVCLSLPARAVTVNRGNAEIELPRRMKEITPETLGTWMRQATKKLLPAHHVAVHCLPKGFQVDGGAPTAHPVGMIGDVLEGTADVVSIPEAHLRQWQQLFKNMDIHSLHTSLGPVMAGDMLLGSQERDHGVLLIDAGAEVTQMAWFAGGFMQEMVSVELGGNHVTNDLSYLLKVPFEEAEQLKKDFGSILESPYPPDYPIAVSTIGKASQRALSVAVLVDIIRPRVEETLTLLRETAMEHLTRSVPARVCMTGGGTMLPGLMEFASQAFDTAVYEGSLPDMEGDGMEIANPVTITALGALHYLVKNGDVRSETNMGLRQVVSSWFNEFF